jgi:hypothetical protein
VQAIEQSLPQDLQNEPVLCAFSAGDSVALLHAQTVLRDSGGWMCTRRI